MVVKDYVIMSDKVKKEKPKMKSLPVYLPEEKYNKFSELCEAERLPMTRVAEAEIDKYIKRNAPKS